MPVIGGPVSAIFIAAVLLVGVVLWLVRERRYPGPRLHGKDDIDREELEAAEREVRELERGALPDDERPGPPTRL
jgi:hypothetical protein